MLKLWFFLALVALVKGQETNQAQFLNLWSTPDCSGVALSLNDDSGNVTIPAGTTQIYYTINGLWNIEHCTTALCTERSVRTGSGADCIRYQTVPTPQEILQLTRYGDAFQNATQIYLFTSPNFEGAQISVDQRGINSISMFAKSWFFTGPNSWGIGAGEEEDKCLDHTQSVEGTKYGFTWKINDELPVASVKFDCKGTEAPEPDPGTDNGGGKMQGGVAAIFLVIIAIFAR